MADALRYRYVDSPIGSLLLVGDGEALTGLYVADHEKARAVEPGWVEDGDDRILDMAETQIGEYFRGDRDEFDVPVRFEGTEFQTTVWHALCDIPFGETISYGELARRIGRPNAVRAVGLANGRNPVSVIVPCHRVIGADGSLTGYGWGTERKAWLLDHERAHAHV